MDKQPGFFDIDERLTRLSGLGDQLEGFRAAVDFEMFRSDLDQALAYADGVQGGRPPFDPVMMFKILVIQATNNLSDDHRVSVRALRRDAPTIGLHRHGGPDRRCEPDRPRHPNSGIAQKISGLLGRKHFPGRRPVAVTLFQRPVLSWRTRNLAA